MIDHPCWRLRCPPISHEIVAGKIMYHLHWQFFVYQAAGRVYQNQLLHLLTVADQNLRNLKGIVTACRPSAEKVWGFGLAPLYLLCPDCRDAFNGEHAFARRAQEWTIQGNETNVWVKFWDTGICPSRSASIWQEKEDLLG